MSFGACLLLESLPTRSLGAEINQCTGVMHGLE